jgi:RNA polymerase sigma factor (sigma-70 family)
MQTELVSRLKANDPLVQQQFWKDHWPQVYGLCMRLLGNDFASSEVATEVLSDFLCQYVHGLNNPKALRSYVRMMAVQYAWKERDRRNRPIHIDMDELGDPSHGNPEELTMITSMLPRLEECLGRLSEKAQQAIKLHYYQEMPNEKIGELLGGSRQYIGRLISQSQVSLRKCLDAYPPNAPLQGGV